MVAVVRDLVWKKIVCFLNIFGINWKPCMFMSSFYSTRLYQSNLSDSYAKSQRI